MLYCKHGKWSPAAWGGHVHNSGCEKFTRSEWILFRKPRFTAVIKPLEKHEVPVREKSREHGKDVNRSKGGEKLALKVAVENGDPDMRDLKETLESYRRGLDIRLSELEMEMERLRKGQEKVDKILREL